MNGNDLAKLRDIHLPEAVSSWPLAPAWYFVIMITMTLLIYLLYNRYHYFQYYRAKHEALKLLAELKKLPNNPSKLTQIALLLKRIALSYHGVPKVAKLSGQEWINFLNSFEAKPVFSKQSAQLITAALYQRQPSLNATYMNQLIMQTDYWIRHASKYALSSEKKIRKGVQLKSYIGES